MPPPTARGRTAGRSGESKRRSRLWSLLPSLAGFTIGLLAVASGLLLTGPIGNREPISDAARRAEIAAAVRMTVDPGSPQALRRPEATRVSFGPTAAYLTLVSQSATRIVIPAVAIDAEVRPVGFVFRDGRLQYDVPTRGAGHYVSTAPPGTNGNAVIGGHVANRTGPAVFERLPDVKAGDMVQVYRGGRLFEYSVTEIRVVPADAVEVMEPTQEGIVTLITCFPDDNYRDRLIVVAKLL